MPPPAVSARNDYLPTLHALQHGDVDACCTMLDSLRPTTLPYPLWESLWALVAQGPLPEPEETLDARLLITIERLDRLRKIHAAAYPDRSLPRIAVHRYAYLVVKQIERAQKHGAQVDSARAAALVDAVGDPIGLDYELLGRVVFRLARLGEFEALTPLFDAYVQRSDRVADPHAAAQPFAAVAEEASKIASLPLALDVLRRAHECGLSIRGTDVQRVLHTLDTPLLQSLAIPSGYTQSPLAETVERLASAHAGNIDYRAAVILCRRGDPLAALELTRRGAELAPFDVFAAAISSLTWIVRDAAAFRDTELAHGAMAGALRVFDDMRGSPGSRGFDGDEQVFGELVRAFEAVLALARDRPLQLRVPQAVPAHTAEALRIPPRDWRGCLDAFTTNVMAHMQTEQVLKPSHFATLLRENARAGHFTTCRRLYECMRKHTGALPLSGLLPVVAWLLRQACRRQIMSFALTLYDDWRAHGRVMALRDALGLVDALLSRGEFAAAHRVADDMRTWPDVARDSCARGLVRTYLAHGHAEAAFDLAVQAYRDDAFDDESQSPPPLAAYAALLREANMVHVGDEMRKFADRLFAEFQLAYAHTLAVSHPVDEQVVRDAYRGIAALAQSPAAAQSILAELQTLVNDPDAINDTVRPPTAQEWKHQKLPSSYYQFS